jgi:hypothetical protein
MTVNQKVDMKNDDLPSGTLGWLKRHERGFLMNKNMKTFSKIGGLGLVGALAFGATQAQAETFNVTTDVQNTLAITVVQEMNLGTLFAATANSSAVSTLILNPDTGAYGTLEEKLLGGSAGDGPSLVSLGGQQPAIGSVATSEDFKATLPAGLIADLDVLTDFDDQNQAVLDGDIIEVRIGGAGGDPSVARFYLTDFIVGGETADSNLTQNANVASFAPGFGVSTVEFAIGATVITDGSGDRDSYEAGTYTGTFDVEAAF